MFKLTPAHISYKKDATGVVEEKFILPSNLPDTLITAIDLGGLTVEEVDEITVQRRAYNEYIKEFLARAFKFEDWVEHTYGKRPDVKWRSYKVENIVKSD